MCNWASVSFNILQVILTAWCTKKPRKDEMQTVKWQGCQISWLWSNWSTDCRFISNPKHCRFPGCQILGCKNLFLCYLMFWGIQCRSYFMFHGMDVNQPESIFKFLPILSFTETYIYQVNILCLLIFLVIFEKENANLAM